MKMKWMNSMIRILSPLKKHHDLKLNCQKNLRKLFRKYASHHLGSMWFIAEIIFQVSASMRMKIKLFWKFFSHTFIQIFIILCVERSEKFSFEANHTISNGFYHKNQIQNIYMPLNLTIISLAFNVTIHLKIVVK